MSNALKTENYAIAHIEKTHMKKQRLIRYTALEDIDYEWDRWEVKKAVRLWKQGLHLQEIAKQLGRSEDDTFALLWDQSRKGKIKVRIGGIFGINRGGCRVGGCDSEN